MAPDPREREWLSLIPRLMREVKPEDYIWSLDAAGQARREARRARLAGYREALRLIGLTVMMLLALHIMGYRRVSAAEDRTLAMADRLDPEHEVDDDRVLAELWGKLPQAYRLVRLAVGVAPAADQYPYIATLTGYPAPAVSPGNAPALLLLGNALEFYPAEVQVRLIQHLLALAVALDEPDIMAALQDMARLPTAVRQKLFAGGAQEFQRIVALGQAIEIERGQSVDIGSALEAQRVTLEKKRLSLQHDLNELVAMAQHDDRVTKACSRRLDRYIDCLPADDKGAMR